MAHTARKLAVIAAAGVLVAIPAFLAGCIHRSGGEWMVRSASVPEGWPDITPVGQVRVQAYPEYRAASVTDAQIQGEGMRPMFMELFGHIKDNDIAMTAPVEMTYDRSPRGPTSMATMAFLHRSTALGQTGEDGPLRLGTLPPMTHHPSPLPH